MLKHILKYAQYIKIWLSKHISWFGFVIFFVDGGFYYGMSLFLVPVENIIFSNYNRWSFVIFDGEFQLYIEFKLEKSYETLTVKCTLFNISYKNNQGENTDRRPIKPTTLQTKPFAIFQLLWIFIILPAMTSRKKLMLH